MKSNSEALNNIDSFRKQTLVDLYNQCFPKQQELFRRMYFNSPDEVDIAVRVHDIPDDKINWAIQQCENTIKNIKSGKYKRED